MALNLSFGVKLKNDDMIVMLTTLSWMLSSGLSVNAGVQELLDDPNNKINKKGLEVLQVELNEGKVLSEIFRDHEDVFGTGHWRQIDAAERTGKVSECLLRIADQIRNGSNLMGKVRNASIYPAMIMLMALAAGYYMFTTIVPQMGEMLIEFEVELPALTQVVMGIANFLINHFVLLLVGIIVVIVGVVYLIKKPLKFKWHKLITRLPFIGQISVNMNYSMIYVLLNDMIENGAHMVEALRVASASSSNIYIMSELEASAEAMEREGYGLTEALLSTNTMPSDDKLMLQVGSRTGREMELLSSLSVRRKDAAYASVNTLMEIMPTALLLFVAVIVGVMVVSIYMPMISMATSVA